MELKEQLLGKIEEIILDELNLKEHSVLDVYKVGEKIQAVAEEFGKAQYNQALIDSEEQGAFWSDHHEEELLGVNTLHKLKKH